MNKVTLWLSVSAFIGGMILAIVSIGSAKYRIDVPIKCQRAPSESVLCLEDAKNPQNIPEAFTLEERIVLLDKLKKARLCCKVVGLPEPIRELPIPDYTVRATIPFYYDSFEFFRTGELLNANLCGVDAEIVREIILNVARRLKRKNGNEI